MSRGRRLAFLAFGVFCALAAVSRATHGDTAWALAFGGFGLTCFTGAFMTRRPPARAQAGEPNGTVRVEGEELPAVQIPYSVSKTWLAIGGSLGFVLAGVGLILAGRTVIGLLGVVSFGVFALLGLRSLVRPPMVSLSERGVHLRNMGGHRWVPWEEVESVYEEEISRTPFIGVDGSHGARWEGPRLGLPFSPFRRMEADINIPVHVIGVDSESLLETLNELVADPAARKRIAAGASSDPSTRSVASSA
jgi:hypothetical protein